MEPAVAAEDLIGRFIRTGRRSSGSAPPRTAGRGMATCPPESGRLIEGVQNRPAQGRIGHARAGRDDLVVGAPTRSTRARTKGVSEPRLKSYLDKARAVLPEVERDGADVVLATLKHLLGGERGDHRESSPPESRLQSGTSATMWRPTMSSSRQGRACDGSCAPGSPRAASPRAASSAVLSARRDRPGQPRRARPRACRRRLPDRFFTMSSASRSPSAVTRRGTWDGPGLPSARSRTGRRRGGEVEQRLHAHPVAHESSVRAETSQMAKAYMPLSRSTTPSPHSR